MWFGPFALCLPVVQNLTFCPFEVISISLLLSTFVKNKGKYVFFSHFMSLSSQNKIIHKKKKWEIRSKNKFFKFVKLYLKNTLPLVWTFLSQSIQVKLKFKKLSQTTLIYMINLKFHRSYTFRHTSSNSKRDRQRGRESEKSRSKTSPTDQLLISKTNITRTHDRSTTGLQDHHDQNPWLTHH